MLTRRLAVQDHDIVPQGELSILLACPSHMVHTSQVPTKRYPQTLKLQSQLCSLSYARHNGAYCGRFDTKYMLHTWRLARSLRSWQMDEATSRTICSGIEDCRYRLVAPASRSCVRFQELVYSGADMICISIPCEAHSRTGGEDFEGGLAGCTGHCFEHLRQSIMCSMCGNAN